MESIFDIYNIIFLVIAIMILFRLRSVLGRRTGNERRPTDPYKVNNRNKDSAGDSVITMPNRDAVRKDEADIDQLIDKIAKPDSPLNEGLKKVSESDSSFNPEEFIKGAKLAYELIVTAFANNDRKALKNLLSNDVYREFAKVIQGRESRKETVEFTFIGIETANILEATVKRRIARIVIRFKSQLVSAIKNENGAVISGDENNVSEVIDLWTFSRNVTSEDPNWKLVATDAAD